MKLQPLGDRVVVKPLKAEEKTRGGIILPDTAKERPSQGEIVALGRGKILDSGKVRVPEVKVGDRVIYGKYSGTDVKIQHEDEEFLIMNEDDILAVTKSAA